MGSQATGRENCEPWLSSESSGIITCHLASVNEAGVRLNCRYTSFDHEGKKWAVQSSIQSGLGI